MVLGNRKRLEIVPLQFFFTLIVEENHPKQLKNTLVLTPACPGFSSSTWQSRWTSSGRSTISMLKCTSSLTWRPESWSRATTNWFWTIGQPSRRSWGKTRDCPQWKWTWREFPRLVLCTWISLISPVNLRFFLFSLQSDRNSGAAAGTGGGAATSGGRAEAETSTDSEASSQREVVTSQRSESVLPERAEKQVKTLKLYLK